jgi:hypothetical protein
VSIIEDSPSATPDSVTKEDSPTGPDSLNGHASGDAHCPPAVEGQDSPQANGGTSPSGASPAGTEATRTARYASVPNERTLSGPSPLNGQSRRDPQDDPAVEGTSSPQAILASAPKDGAPAGAEDPRTANGQATPIRNSLAGSSLLSGQCRPDAHRVFAVEGSSSPQAITSPSSSQPAPAGSKASRSQAAGDTQPNLAAADNSPPAIGDSPPKPDSPEGRETSRSQRTFDAQRASAAADDIPGGQARTDTQTCLAAGEQAPVPVSAHSSPILPAPVRDQAPPAATSATAPNPRPLLADPLLALAADVLGDLEKVRIANENRLRQLTRSAEDSDGETRGFGLDEAHPDVARLAALVGMLGEAEHKATLNLQRVMRKHPLGPWVAAQKGIGEKQGARLLAAIGDPYIRPEITCEDGTVEPSRPRMVSELWAYCGYHVVPADHGCSGTQVTHVGGELNGSGPGHGRCGTHSSLAGVAPKRQRGQHANWSAAAKMRAFLVAESCMKQSGTTYRAVYDATKAKYADAAHATECVRCGPKNKPAQPGSPLSDGHKHARALRAVAKEILKDLWREAKRIHETSVSGHKPADTHRTDAADGDA